MISGAFYFGVQTRFAQTGGPRAEWKSPSITLMNFIKRLKSVVMIYILPTPVKTLQMPTCSNGKFEYSNYKSYAGDVNFYVLYNNIKHKK